MTIKKKMMIKISTWMIIWVWIKIINRQTMINPMGQNLLTILCWTLIDLSH